MVFYRKYRPQTINDLDSEAVREALTAILKQSDPPHALLFTGPKGLGKTSAARIVAKAVNCEKNKFAGVGKSIEPCNECEQCVSVTNGAHVDIIEIDGASNRNIDDVRDLKEKIRLSPASARKKVYIIDEVHMFTTDSFNALLKTLEEPPSHAMFILCTTEKHKVPATIMSRCFTVEFRSATKEELARSFKRIAKGEGLVISDEALEAIGSLAEGGFRDAQKVLEELSTVAVKGAITKELVEEKYKTSTIQHEVASLVNHLQSKDAKQALEVVIKVAEVGADIKYFMFQLVEELHKGLLQKAGVIEKSEVGPARNASQNDAGGSTKYQISIEELRELLILLMNAYAEMKHAVLPQLPLELAIIEWTSSKPATVESVVSVEKKVSVTTNGSAVTVSSMRKQVGDLAKVRALYGEEKPVKQAPSEDNTPRVNLMNISNSEITPEWLQSFWITFISEMKQYNHTIAGVLRGCMIKSYDKENLIIETSYKFHKERLNEAKTKEALGRVCKLLTGNSVSVEVVLRE